MTRLVDLVDTSQRVGAVPGRKAKIGQLADLLRSLEPAEVELAAHYLSGEIPQGKIGIGYSALRAAAAASPEPPAQGTLSIADVDRTIAALAAINGAGSAARRTALLRQVFARATADERHFLLRLLVGELRQGALTGLMVDAIAAAAGIAVTPVRRAAMYAGGLGAVARVAILDGADALARFDLTLFAPVAPMLAQTAADVAQALEQLGGTAVFEWKMDGARIQAHKVGAEVRIYTRALNEVTDAVPEIVEAVRGIADHTLVLDGEAIAFDAAGRPHPFQVTMRRFGRKLDVAALRATLPIRAYFFDCLYTAGRSIVEQPLRERERQLERLVPAEMRFPRLVTTSPADALAFYRDALATGHEGVMAKDEDSRYEAGNRGSGWLKVKRTHTLDLVVLGAEWGHGRRAGSLSNLHLGALDPASGDYVMLGKTFKGLTDAMLAWQTKEFLARETRRDAGTVYIRPDIVVEVAFSDLQASIRYPGGLALRLARVKRYRDDKRAADADTMDTVRQVYAAQTGGPALTPS